MVDVPPDPESGLLAVTRALCRELVAETGIDGVGVAVFASASTRDLVFATDVLAEELDELQFTVGEGPCLDAYRFGSRERIDDLLGTEALARWPIYSTQASALGAASVYAYPLGADDARLGVLELYGRSPVTLTHRDDVRCRLFARSIGHAVLRELDPGTLMVSGSGEGVFRRGNVNVAAGMVAARLRISVEEALVRLRALAFSRQRRITAIAQDIIGGEQFDTDADVG